MRSSCALLLRRLSARGSAIAASILALTILAADLEAHECDQFSVPAGKRFADLRDYISNIAWDALNRGLEITNDKLRKAVARGASSDEIDALFSPDEIAGNVYRSFPNAVILIEDIEGFVNRKSSRSLYPGRIVGFQDFSYIYDNNLFPLDPRQVFKIWRSSSILVNGTYLGTDKIGHFTDMGMNYYKTYRQSLADGNSEEQAIADAVRLGTHDGFLGERGVLGFVSSGVYSNADLAANYAGMKFYINLTLPIPFEGGTRPPMLIRQDNLWTLAPHVTKDSNFVLDFITPHYDEVLNPSLHTKGMRTAVRKAIEKRADKVLAWYADANGMQRTPHYFDQRRDELRTWFGEDYGWWDDDGDIVTINETCFQPVYTQLPAPSPFVSQLLTATYQGDPQSLRASIEDGADVNARLMPASPLSSEAGNTALHLAARRGAVDELHLLLQAGANVAAQNIRLVTPLHMAAQQPAAAQRLLDAGAQVSAVDVAGRSPLHWACNEPNADVVTLLIQHGAHVNLPDNNGMTPLHLAAQAGNVEAITTLLERNADPHAKARYAITPLHLAALHNHDDAVQLLAQHGANVDAPDEFGITPLHEAARLGNISAVRALLDARANPNARDAYNSTPLHLAARHDRQGVAALLLDHGADPGAGNNFGLSPVEEARRKKCVEVTSLLTNRSSR